MSTPNYISEPCWQTIAHLRQAELPAATRRWLLDEGSLTDHLIRTSGGNFTVHRLSQSWAVPTLSERQFLGLKQRQLALIRQVVLLCHDQPWVFARSVLPLQALQGPLRHLRKLHNQSLGSLLFKQANLRRGAFEVAALESNCAYIHPLLRQAEPAWARRSRFHIGSGKLLVSEVFLSAFQPWPSAHSSV